jgi:misacylated tRNA(Ala) deacylase
MRTHEMHRDQPDLQNFVAEIVAVTDNSVELNRSAFYARSGGQAGDTGAIGDVPVLDTFYNSDRTTVLHVIDPQYASELHVGRTVHASIWWPDRWRRMRLHAAQHFTYLAVVDQLGPRPPTGGDINTERARLDVAHTHAEPKLDLERLNEQINDMVAGRLTIHRYRQRNAPDRWWWAVEGAPPIPCGGTHPGASNLIGPVTVTAARKGSKNSRLTVELLEPAAASRLSPVLGAARHFPDRTRHG